LHHPCCASIPLTSALVFPSPVQMCRISQCMCTRRRFRERLYLPFRRRSCLKRNDRVVYQKDLQWCHAVNSMLIHDAGHQHVCGWRKSNKGRLRPALFHFEVCHLFEHCSSCDHDHHLGDISSESGDNKEKSMYLSATFPVLWFVARFKPMEEARLRCRLLSLRLSILIVFCRVRRWSPVISELVLSSSPRVILGSAHAVTFKLKLFTTFRMPLNTPANTLGPWKLSARELRAVSSPDTLNSSGKCVVCVTEGVRRR